MFIISFIDKWFLGVPLKGEKDRCIVLKKGFDLTDSQALGQQNNEGGLGNSQLWRQVKLSQTIFHGRKEGYIGRGGKGGETSERREKTSMRGRKPLMPVSPVDLLHSLHAPFFSVLALFTTPPPPSLPFRHLPCRLGGPRKRHSLIAPK